MPRATFPPTPASSTDIQGQDGSKQLASLQTSFELPPPAMNTGNTTDAASAKNKADVSTDINMMSPPIYPETTSTASSPSAKGTAYPVQAAEAVKSRRRSSAVQAQALAKDAFALPPPPTRSRKIIQMKPRAASTSAGATAAADTPGMAPATAPVSASSGSKGPSGKGGAGAVSSATTSSEASSAAATASAATASTSNTGGKKKQPSATSAAGRKIARKTAHSLIERRRRSKMNEEFAVLKGMIPACTGEMHKLAILQASIEYVRYLEDCVATLKAQCESESNQRHVPASPTDESRLPTPSGGEQYNPERHYPASYADGQSPDVEMAGTGEVADDMVEDEDEDEDEDLPSPTAYATRNPHSTSASSRSVTHQPPVSPALAAQDASFHRQQRHDSQSSTASLAPTSDHHRHYSYSTSAQTSPAFGPQVSSTFHHYGSLSTTASNPGSTLTSPALAPQRDLDQEATAALLMLNSDRRGAGGNNASGRGMSVRDLLST